MKPTSILPFITLTLAMGSVWASSNALTSYNTIASLQGDWQLSPATLQQGGATKKGPAAKLLGTNRTAMNFKVIGKGSTVQETLLPGTPKEMATMYHCDNFKNCNQVKATHYCAKQNQPALVLDERKSSGNIVVASCDMNTTLCQSAEAHVHQISHELSADNNHLKTTYAIYKDGKQQKLSVYHFDRK